MRTKVVPRRFTRAENGERCINDASGVRINRRRASSTRFLATQATACCKLLQTRNVARFCAAANMQRIYQYREAGLAGVARADEYRQRSKLDLTLLDGAEVLHRDADIGMGRVSGASHFALGDHRHVARATPFRATGPMVASDLATVKMTSRTVPTTIAQA